VIHPTRGSLLLMCTDTSLDAIDIIRLMWTAPVVKRFLAPEFKFLSSSGEASERMLEKGDCASAILYRRTSGEAEAGSAGEQPAKE
jgi:hypothetical protein